MPAWARFLAELPVYVAVIIAGVAIMRRFRHRHWGRDVGWLIIGFGVVALIYNFAGKFF